MGCVELLATLAGAGSGHLGEAVQFSVGGGESLFELLQFRFEFSDLALVVLLLRA